MALIIPPTTLPDAFQEFTLGANLLGGYLQITGNPAVVELLYGRYGGQEKVPPQILPLGSYRVDRSPAGVPLSGVRARNATAGLGSVLGGYFWTESDPTISFIGLASSQAVGAVLIPRVSVADLPTLTPVDEQVVALEADLANDVIWLLQFRAATNEWLFAGGPPMVSEVAAEQATSSAAYGNLATTGPTVAIPIAGDYEIEHGFTMLTNTAANVAGMMSYDIGGVAATDADACGGWLNTADGTYRVSYFARRKKTLTAISLVGKYRSVSANSIDFRDRWIRARPYSIPA